MNIAAIVQARLGSSRLPEKILKPLPFNSDITILGQVIRRIRKSKIVNEVIIATTEKLEDNLVADLAIKEGVKFFKGSENDVLSRYYFAAKEYNIDLVVRITSDCPCIDSDIIDDIIEKSLESGADYTGNTLNRTFPRGLDVEVIKFSALEKAFLEADKDYEREHVSDFIYENPQIFKLLNVCTHTKEDNSHIRLTVDTYEDYMLLCAVYDYLYFKNEFFNYDDIIKLFNEKPWLNYINNDINQKKYKETGSY